MKWNGGWIICVVFSVCAGCGSSSVYQTSGGLKTWDGMQIGGIQSSASHIAKMIPVRLNPDDANDQRVFFLHYFAVLGNKNNGPRKTILFCIGGPGETLSVTESDGTIPYFLKKFGYDVVYYHLRGSGFSQIPPSNEFDRYLRTSLAVKDIEEIRRDFLGSDQNNVPKQWDAVIGWSYGTVIAHQYAHEFPQHLKKLLLVGPISRRGFQSDQFSRISHDIHQQNLEMIYQLDDFRNLDRRNKNKIIAEVFGNGNDQGIFTRSANEFGSLQVIIDNYCELKLNGELRTRNLNFSRNFFVSLRQLRFVGWFPSDDDTVTAQKKIGQTIKVELLESRRRPNNECSEKPSFVSENSSESKRDFYVIGTYDGIDPRFLREWLSGGEREIQNALRLSGGAAHVQKGINKSLSKVGIFEDLKIEPWDPSKYTHGIPTLILKGEADPVAAGEQANDFFSKALTGPRTLLSMPGIGHNYALPEIPSDGTDDSDREAKKFFSGIIQFDATNIPAKTTKQLVGVVNGPELNDGFVMELTPLSSEDNAGLKQVGFGATIGETRDKTDNNIVALVENTTGGLFAGGTRKWTVSNGYFTGDVNLDVPPIPAREIRLATGKITKGVRNQKRKVQFIQPELEEGLVFECSGPSNLIASNRSKGAEQAVVGDNNYNLLFKNTHPSKTVGGASQLWSIRNEYLNQNFEVELTSPRLDPGMADTLVVSPEDMKPDPDAEIQLIRPKELDSSILVYCLNQNEDTGAISIVMLNTSGELIEDNEIREWTIKTASFDATLKVGPLKLKAQEVVTEPAILKEGIKWKKEIELIPPTDFESDLELIGFNILAPDKISVLVRNNGVRDVAAKARSWSYVDHRKDTPCKIGDKVRDCLIYSYIVMDSEMFSHPMDNKVVDIIESVFTNNANQRRPAKIVNYCDPVTCASGR